MADCVAENSKVLTFYGGNTQEANSVVAVDQHFARALSSKPTSPQTPSEAVQSFRRSGLVEFHPPRYRQRRFHYKRQYAWGQVDFHHHIPIKRARFAMPLPPPPPPPRQLHPHIHHQFMIQAPFPPQPQPPLAPLHQPPSAQLHQPPPAQLHQPPPAQLHQPPPAQLHQPPPAQLHQPPPGCVVPAPSPAQCVLSHYPGWFPSYVECHPTHIELPPQHVQQPILQQQPPVQQQVQQQPVQVPVRKEKPLFVFPEFSSSIVQPVVDSFAHLPRLPGEGCSCGSVPEQNKNLAPSTEQSPSEQPPTEQRPSAQPPSEQRPSEQPPTEQRHSEQPPTEQVPDPFWGSTSAKSSPDGQASSSPAPPPLPVAVSSTQLRALMDDLRMTDQELDGILELNGEI